MAGMITRCPKCATAFRISDAHLKSAKGMVRCGSCLDVFNAREHIQERELPKKTVTPAQAQAKNQAAHTAASIKQAAQPARAPQPKPQPTATSKPTMPVEPTQKPQGTLDSSYQLHHDEEDDESWALELLKDDSEPDIKLKKIVTSTESKRDNTASASAVSAAASASPTKATIAASAAAPTTTKTTTTETEAEAAPTKEPQTTKAPSSTAEHSIRDMLAAIEPDALEVNWEDDQTRRKKRMIWTLLSLAASVLLTAQIAWLEFHRFNTIEPYRTGYALVCPLLGCTLPDLKNLRAISTSNLVVRTHPVEKGALMVDVIIQNTALFEQQFPHFVLSFSDLQNNLVAARRFSPSEYLGGELAGVSHMPINQPIHIALEILDPGLSALSYNIAVVD